MWVVTYDHGAENFENTVETLTAEGISVFGDQKNQDKSTIVYTKVNGKVVAMSTPVNKKSTFNLKDQKQDLYLISIYQSNKKLKTFKLIKTN